MAKALHFASFRFPFPPVALRSPAPGFLAFLVLAFSASTFAAPALYGQNLFIDDTQIIEGDSGTTLAVFTVSISFPPDPVATVEYRTLDGTATVTDEDYVPTSGLLVFDAQTEEQTIAVPVIGDPRVEPDEVFLVELFNAVGAQVFDPIGEGRILNDDEPVNVILSLSDTSVVEGDSGPAPAVFTATLSEPSSFPVTARYATRDGSATAADLDYAPASGLLTFPPGTRSVTFTVFAQGDTRPEGDEVFYVVLGDAMNATLGDSRGTATILDDDGTPPSLSIGDAEVQEGDEGTVTAVFSVQLSAPSGNTVAVDFTTADGSATEADGDYSGSAGRLTFAPGEVTGTVQVEVVGDLRSEPDETFFVDLSNPENATVEDGRGVGTIRDDDTAGQEPSLSVDDVEVQEGDSGVTQALFTVRLSEASPSGEAVRVRFATADDTARVGDGDYRAASGELLFGDGETSKTVAVEVLGDRRPEADETFFLNLSQPENATLGDSQGIGTLLNDDLPEISIGDAAVSEGDAGTVGAIFRISLDQPAAQPVTVSFATRDGSATTADGDYRQTTGVRTLPAGETTATVTVEVVGDVRVEGDEIFFVDLSDPDGATLADATGQGTIRDDDRVPGQIRLLAPAAVEEGAGRALVEVERSSPADGPASVRIEARGGTARAGDDFTAVARTLEWGAGETGVRRFFVPILDDRQEESTESLRIRLRNPSGAGLGQPAEADLVILDDDTPLELTASGETSLAAAVGQRLGLEVQVRDGDGEGVEGIAVEWSVEGDAALPEGDRSTTDGDGLASLPVELGDSAGVVRITARIVGSGASSAGDPVVFEIRVEGNLGDLFEPGRSPGEAAVADALDQACVGAQGDLRGLCDFLFALEDPSLQIRAVEELTPKDVAAQATLTLNAAQVQLRNVAARQASLRRAGARAGTGGSTPGSGTLTLELRGETLRLADLGSALAPALLSAAELEEAVERAFFLEEQNPDEGAEEIPEVAQGVKTSRWGLFASGSLAIGDRPASGREAGFDFDTQGLTAGLDYRLNDRVFLGGAVGYLETSSDVAGGGGLEVDGFSLLAYGSYYVGSFYLDAVLGYGRNDYRQARTLDLPRPFQGQTRFVAQGDADGRQLSASLRAGYDLQRGATTFQGFGGLSTVDVEIDAYGERGAGPFNLTYADQDSRSLVSEVGLEIARAASVSWGVLRPMARVSVLHEFEDDPRRIRARFSAAGSGIEFGVPTEEPDRDYLNLAAGLTATLPRGRTFYLTYELDVGRDDLDQSVIAAGFRLEL